MAFEIKYDRDGLPIPPKGIIQESEKNPIEQSEQQPLEQVLQAVEEPVEQAPEQKQPEPPLPEPTPIETAQARNFKQLREQKENFEREAQRLARERDEANRELQELRASKQQQFQTEPQEDITIDTDDLVQGKHLKSVKKEIAALKEQLKYYQYQSQETAAEARLKVDYPDIYQVLTNDNIATLKAMEPELAASVAAAPDLYTKAVSTYKLVKKLGIHGDDTTLREKQALVRNAAKPRLAASVSPQQGDSPLSKVNAFADPLTDELKTQLYKEMIAARKDY